MSNEFRINMNNNNNINSTRRKSIRLQIELPLEQQTKPDEFNSSIHHNQCCQQADDSQFNTICLQISFDSLNRAKNCCANKQFSSSSSTSSGYSSSASSQINYAWDDGLQAQNLRRNSINILNKLKKPVASQLPPAPLEFLDDENVYDKLNYTAKRRYSLSSSDTSSISSSSSLSASTTKIHNNDYSYYGEEDIYEEISNFCASKNEAFTEYSKSKLDACNYSRLEEFKSATSSQSSIKRINKCNQVVGASQSSGVRASRGYYKREYTVNEIFQNLKSFQEDATKLEAISEKKVGEEPAKPVDVGFLKRIFETKTEMKKEVVVSRPPLPPAQMLKAAQAQHVYVNERISKPVNV